MSFAVRQRTAERAMAAAEAAGAQLHATYEMVLARRYLDKAREESAEAHYAWALALLAKSERNAERAQSLSVERAARASTAGYTPLSGAGNVQGNLR